MQNIFEENWSVLWGSIKESHCLFVASIKSPPTVMMATCWLLNEVGAYMQLAL